MAGTLREPAAENGRERRGDAERRHGARRATKRGGRDRRRGERRGATVRHLTFAMMAVSIPHQLDSSRHALLAASFLPEVCRPLSIATAIALPASRAYDALIVEAAARYRVSPILIRAVMQAESAFNPFAISRAGAMGLMQLMPDIAVAFDIAHPFDPRENIMGGTRLLRELLDSHHHDVRLVLAAYNAGPTAVARYGGVPPFRETQGYVKKIINLIADANDAGDE